jgi:hypothetical protein
MSTVLATVTTPTQAPGGSAYASWETLIGGLVLVTLLGLAALVLGRPPEHRSVVVRTLLRAPEALSRLTGLPDWAAIATSISTVGLVIAGMGFSSDVAYHVAYGRDTVLFTPPHTAIFIGLTLIAAGAAAGVAVATLQRVETVLRPNGLRVPWSMLPLGVLGIAAVLGFPIDELWHQAYGVDVTMWSPPHLIMILGAAFTGLALWLVLADVGVRPTDSRRALVLHVIAAMLTFQGFIAPGGEFSFGTPQFQQLYHPVLIALAGTAALVLIRLVLGRGWALGLAALTFLLSSGGIMGGDSPVETRPIATFLGIALAVEVVAWLAGTRRRLRFALLAGLGAGTFGLGVEWFYNQQAHQPWTTALLPDAFVVGVPAALAAAVLATAVAGALTGSAEPRQDAAHAATMPPPAVVIAGVGVLVTLLIPLPRQVGDVTADITLEETAPGRVLVTAELDPPDAAEGARWFMVGSWQHGGRESARMLPVGEGVYTAERDISVDGWAKSLLRLHRGAEMMTVPIRLPADPEIGEPEIPATDRVAAFEEETRYLLRETTDGPAVLGVGVRALFALLVSAWVAAFAVAGTRIARGRGTLAEQLSAPAASAGGRRSP